MADVTALKLNMDDLTLDEVEEIEDILDMGFDQLVKSSRKGKMMKAVAYVLAKRQDPSITMEDVGRIKVSQLDEGEAGPLAS